MKKVSMAVVLAFSTLAFSSAYAAGGPMHNHGRGSGECPSDVQARMDMTADPANLQFGAGTSAITECLKYRSHVNVVVNVSTKDVNGKGVQQQINNANNMWDNYESNYGMEIHRDYDIKVVVHGFAGKYMLKDDVFVAKFPAEAKLITEADGSTHMGSPTGKVIRDLIAKGIDVYMCQNTMKNNGWATVDLIEGTKQVPGGVTAAIDFAMQGYTLMSP